MPVAAFPALFEVAALSVGLTVSCIVGFRHAARCLGSGSGNGGGGVGCKISATPLYGSGLSASLLAAFCCMYGLIYWFNGTNGHDCLAYSVVMNTCLKASNGLSLLYLFILSNMLHQTNARWRVLRWLGLVLTAFHWGVLVASEATRTAEEVHAGASAAVSSAFIGNGMDVGAGIDAAVAVITARCLTRVDDAAFSVQWVAQLFSQVFQAVTFLIPLVKQEARVARVRSIYGVGFTYPGKNRYMKNTGILKVWQSIVAVSVSLLMTIVVASLALAKAQGQLDSMPMFAVEILDNTVNLAATFYAIHAIPVRNPVPMPNMVPRQLHPRPKSMLGPSHPAQNINKCHSFGGFSSSKFGGAPFGGDGVSDGYYIRRRSDGSISHRNGFGASNRGGKGGRVCDNTSVEGRRARPNSIGVVSATPSFSSFSPSSLQRRYTHAPISRLPPVLDMSPEETNSSGHGSSFCSRPGSRSPSAAAAVPSPPPSGCSSAAASAPLSVSTTPAAATVALAAAAAATAEVAGMTEREAAEGTRQENKKEKEPEKEPEKEGSTPLSSFAKRYDRPVGTLFFASRTTKNRWMQPGSHPNISSVGGGDDSSRTPVQNRIALARGASAPSIYATISAGGKTKRASSSSTGSMDSTAVTPKPIGVPEAGGRGRDGEGDSTAVSVLPLQRWQQWEQQALRHYQQQGRKQQEVFSLPRPAPSSSSSSSSSSSRSSRGRTTRGAASSTSGTGTDGRGPAKKRTSEGTGELWTRAPAGISIASSEPTVPRGTTNVVRRDAAAVATGSSMAWRSKPADHYAPDVSPRVAAAAAAAAAAKVMWPRPPRPSVPANDPPGGRRRPVMPRESSLSNSLAAMAEDVDRPKGIRSVAPRGEPTWQRQRQTTERVGDLPPTSGGTAGAGTRVGVREAPTWLGGDAKLEVEVIHAPIPVPTASSSAAAAAAAPKAAAAASLAARKRRTPLERRFSAWSAFSAASWCSSSFDGYEPQPQQHGALSATVLSPASYLRGTFDG